MDAGAWYAATLAAELKQIYDKIVIEAATNQLLRPAVMPVALRQQKHATSRRCHRPWSRAVRWILDLFQETIARKMPALLACGLKAKGNSRETVRTRSVREACCRIYILIGRYNLFGSSFVRAGGAAVILPLNGFCICMCLPKGEKSFNQNWPLPSGTPDPVTSTPSIASIVFQRFPRSNQGRIWAFLVSICSVVTLFCWKSKASSWNCLLLRCCVVVCLLLCCCSREHAFVFVESVTMFYVEVVFTGMKPNTIFEPKNKIQRLLALSRKVPFFCLIKIIPAQEEPSVTRTVRCRSCSCRKYVAGFTHYLNNASN